ncbi:hypothetical protein B0H13DRAFT_2575061 [Mycena leptocephala]|nr:hypothetical protein B0H13DRAFT_2575061 [Mycena leptocephala]
MEGDEGRQVSCDAYATKKGRGRIVFMRCSNCLRALLSGIAVIRVRSCEGRQNRAPLPRICWIDDKKVNSAVAPAEDAKFSAAATNPFADMFAVVQRGITYTPCRSHAHRAQAPSRASPALWHLPLHVKPLLGKRFVLCTELDNLLAMDELAPRGPGSGSTSATEEGVLLPEQRDYAVCCSLRVRS